MPDKCCVPQCRGNYTSDTKVHVFRFPRDDELRKAWIQAIPRENLVITQHTRVCELHFKYDDIIREDSYVDNATGRTVSAPMLRLRLRRDAVPSKFPGMSAQHTIGEDPETTRERLHAAATLTALAESVEEERDRIVSLRDLADHIRGRLSPFWHAIEDNERLIFVHIVEDEAPWIKYSLVVKADLTMCFHYVKTPVKKLGSNVFIPTVATNKRKVVEVLEAIENWDCSQSSTSGNSIECISEAIYWLLGKLSVTIARDKDHAVQFLGEQLELLLKKKQQMHYSADLMVFSCILFMISPRAYKFIRNYGTIALPHPTTVRSMCSSLGTNPQPARETATFLSYMAKRIFALDYHERFVAVMVNEVDIEDYFESKGSNSASMALGSTDTPNSAFVFVVQSLVCQFKEAAHIAPVPRADAKFVHKLLRDIICGLEKIGYKVISVASDNNSVSRKAMSYFSSPPVDQIVYPHPSESSRPLFFVTDPAHILKCIRNDWLDQKNERLCFYFPEFQAEAAAAEQRMLTASFASLRDAYRLVRDQASLYGCTLSSQALCPLDIDRANTSLALEIFSNSIPQFLRAVGTTNEDRQLLDETATFIEIIVRWWKVVNVKSPPREELPRDQFQEPVFSITDDPKVNFLYKLLDWLDAWKGKNLDSGMLTKETHSFMQKTTHALLEVTRYCFNELKLPYVLLGKIQTDSLEERFAKYKQLVGSGYHSSIRQVFEGDNEQWSRTSLPMVAADRSATNEHCDDFDRQAGVSHTSCAVAVTGGSLWKIKDMIPVLVYVAGHAVYAALKKMRCSKCRPALTIDKPITLSVAQQHHDLVKELDREGLVFPTMFAVNAVAHSYVVVEQLLKQAQFLKAPNQRQVVVDVTVGLLVNDESSDFDACDDGHTSEVVLKHVLGSSTDILLKNFFCVVKGKSSDDDEEKEKAQVVPKKKKRKIAAKQLKKRPPRLNCEHCEFFADTNEPLLDHYAADHPDKALSTCDSCQARFTHCAYMLMHQAQVHSSLEKDCPQACNLCDQTPVGTSALVDHLRKVHAPGPTYRCVECLERFSTMASLLQHRNETHNPKLRKCPHCPKKFKNAWFCRQHILCSHRSSRLPNSCKHCFRRYKDPITLRYHMALSHMRVLSDEEKASLEPLKKYCTECDYVTFNRRSMEGHMRRKHGDMLQCPHCPSQFALPWELTRHKRLKHSSAGRRGCPHCLRVFACPKTYAVHLTMHEEGQGHECSICKRLFESEAMLNYHSKSHTDTGSRRCRGCLRFFATQDRLVKHQETYSKECPDGTVELTCTSGKNRGPATEGQINMGKNSQNWPHGCDQCHLRFKYESSLSAHKMSAHEKGSKGVKSFTCEICQKSFASVLGLSAHIRTHTGERPFECPECGATFGQKSSLRDHKVLKHSRTFRHHCPLCAKGCISNYTLRKHLQAAHKAVPPGATPIPPRRRRTSAAASTSSGAGTQPAPRKSRSAGKTTVPPRPPLPTDGSSGLAHPGPPAMPLTPPARAAPQAAPRMCRPPGPPGPAVGPVQAPLPPPTTSSTNVAAANNPSAYLLPYLESQQQQQQQAYEARVRQVGGVPEGAFQGGMPPPQALAVPPPTHGAPAAGAARFGMDTSVGSGWRLPSSTVSGFELIYSPQPAHHEQAMNATLPPTHGLNWPHSSQ
ncbi:uncharacterized protein LOC144174000 [Haemaphysalis longicornis]